MRNALGMLLVFLVWTTGVAYAGQIRPSDVASKPNVYCTVLKEPNPALVGHYSCVHKWYDDRQRSWVNEPIEYWLVKLGDKYALYFYRVKEGKGPTYRGWRKWYLQGDKINSGESSEIFVKDGEVYFRWKLNDPTKMTRIE